MKIKVKITAILMLFAAITFNACSGSGLDTSIPSDPGPLTAGAAINYSGITVSSVTVNWGAATGSKTAQSGLRYKLVTATTSEAIDTIAEINAITGSDLLMDWTLNTTTYLKNTLTEATSYYFAVLVKDGDGNTVIYNPQKVTTLDVTAPTSGTNINFTSIASTSVTVNWGEATDNGTIPSGLSYKVVKAASAAAIDTIAEADAITGSDQVMNWALNTVNFSSTGLSEGTVYYFAVLVKDGNGNMANYSPQTVTTLDVTAPTAGTAISFTNVAATSVTVNWGAASDNTSSPGALSYKLVKATTSAAIDTIAEVDAIIGSDLVMDWTLNSVTTSAISLTEGTVNYFAVLVKDGAGNKSIYSPQAVVPATLVNAQWAKSAGGSVFKSVVVDSTGNIYTAGYVSGSTTYTFAAGVTATGKSTDTNVLIVKYNSSGTAQWARTVTSTIPINSSSYNSIAVDSSDNVYAAGAIGNSTYDFGNSISASGINGKNLVIVKYNSSGDVQWARSVSSGPGFSELRSVVVDSNNSIIAAGYIGGGNYYFGSTTVFGQNGGNNVLIVKYDSSGVDQWAWSALLGPSDSEFFSVAVDSSNNAYAVGVIRGNGQYQFSSGCLLNGGTTSMNIVVVKYTTAGYASWAKSVTSGTSDSLLTSIAIDSSDNIYAGGTIYGAGTYNFGNSITLAGASSQYNMLLLKYNTSGTAQWAKTITPGSASSFFVSLTVDSSGNLFAGGNIYGTGTFTFGPGVFASGSYNSGYNIFLTKYSSSGVAQWAKTVTSGSGSFFNSIFVKSGNVFGVGSISSTGSYDFGNSITVTSTGSGLLLIKYQ